MTNHDLKLLLMLQKDAAMLDWQLVVTAAVGLGGVGLGLTAARGRELRDMRRTVYMEWMKAARSMASWPGPPIPAGSTIQIPHPANKARLNEVTAELGVVASTSVTLAVHAYTEHYLSPGLEELMRDKSNLDSLVDVFDQYMTPRRLEVLRAMRRDLFPWWLWRQWDVPSLGEQGESRRATPSTAT